MIALIENISQQHAEELRAVSARRRFGRSVRQRRRGPSSPRRRSERHDASSEYGARLAGYGERLTIRRLDRSADRPAIERVAGRDTAAVPEGELLGAELDGALVAALSTSNGRAVADPFTPSAEAVVLLRRRAEQIRTAGHRRGLARRLLSAPIGRAG